MLWKPVCGTVCPVTGSEEPKIRSFGNVLLAAALVFVGLAALLGVEAAARLFVFSAGLTISALLLWPLIASFSKRG